MTPRRLYALLARWGGPPRTLAAVQRGLAVGVLCDQARADDIPRLVALARVWAQVATSDRIPLLLASRGTHVFIAGADGYPIADDLPDRPAVLLGEGKGASALARPRVAVVGTRAATPHGLADARELGAVLGDAGVTVVSGLAIGIDAAAHEGALEAGGHVIGVVATGLDVVYPRRHQVLFRRVRDHGLLISELGYGVGPRRAAFPVRNRIIAALADVVVVVEATVKGGARITAERALDYGRPVHAMPGSRRNPAAAGTNELIRDGASPVLEPSDVLLAVGLTAGTRRAVHRPAPRDDARTILEACGGEPATFDQLASRTGLRPDQIAVGVRELQQLGWMDRVKGRCWPRGQDR